MISVNNMKKKVLNILSFVVFFVCACVLLFYFISDAREQAVNDDVSSLKNNGTSITEVLDEYAGVYAENKDTIGWLRIGDTAIDYVVMYAPDEIEKYLRTDFYGNPSTGGCLYVDEFCDIFESDNIIIYGHNMSNGTMFADLLNYSNYEFAMKHSIIRFDTIYEKHEYELVAAIYTDLKGDRDTGFLYYEYTEADDPEKFAQYCEFIEKNRAYDTGVSLEEGDKILTLSTCSYHTDGGRFIVIARQIS